MPVRLPLLLAASLSVATLTGGCSKDNKAPTSSSSTATCATTTGAVAATKTASASWAVVGKGGDLGALVRAEAVKAQAAGKKPVVYIGAGWCPPCAAIKKYKADTQMVAAFERAYIIELDVDDWQADDLAALHYNAKAVPIFIAVDKDAKAKGPTIDGGAWGDNIPANMAPPLTKFFASI